MTVTEHLTPAPAPDALPPMDVAGRLDRLRSALDAAECDALVVSELTNVRYLTGFTGSAALLLVTADGAVFVTDGRYRDQSADQLAAAGVDADVQVVGAEPDATVAAAATAAGVRRLGLEADSVTWTQQRRWSGTLFGNGELVPTSGVVEGLRLVKDAGEAARIRSACAVADAAFADVRPLLAERPTEEAFALALDGRMRELGAADVSFETIVAAGPNGARPHHRPGGRVVEDGDLVVVDFGALVDGYHSDMTRTVAVGDVGAERARMLEVVLAAQEAGVEAVAAGVEAVEVDRACRSVIDGAGWGDAFLHSTGHGVGLDIHEEPRVSARSTATLVAGHVVTVEPGVYLTGLGGVRIEDTVLVTEGGCDRLTLAPKDPILA
ncbi:MAG: M24 family metallopeptidase [Microthrixaceae bacterium]